MCQAGRSKANGGWYYHTGWARVWRASILVQDASAIEGASGWWCWWWARLWLTCLDGRSYAGRQELDFICTNTWTVKTKGNWKTNKQAVDRHHHHHDKHHPHCHYPFSSQPPAGCRRGIIIKRSRARHGVQQQHNTHTYQHTHTLGTKHGNTNTCTWTYEITTRGDIRSKKYKRCSSTNYRAEVPKRSQSTIWCKSKQHTVCSLLDV